MERLKNMTRDGFTLVELMVVVAIIGILATLAVPQYKKFQAKSRQSEARLSLGGAYTIEQSFAAENSSYTSCLGQAGYNRDGVRFYYSVGLDANSTAQATCGPTGALDCNYTAWNYDPTAGTYSDDGNTKCDDTANNTGVFMATSAEDSTQIPPDAATAQKQLTAIATTKANVNFGGAFVGMSQQAFTIGATGSILSGSGALALTNPLDGWTIDQNKQVRNTQSGLY